MVLVLSFLLSSGKKFSSIDRYVSTLCQPLVERHVMHKVNVARHVMYRANVVRHVMVRINAVRHVMCRVNVARLLK